MGLRFSIVIPAYNVEKTFIPTLECVLNEDFPSDKYEVIVVNDGSSDKTLEILSRYQMQYRHLKVLDQSNSGCFMAFLNGSRMATGEYIIRCDADDLVEKDMLIELDRYITDNGNDCDIIYYDYYLVKNHEKSIVRLDIKELDSYILMSRLLKSSEFNNLWFKCCKRSLFEDLVVDDSFIGFNKSEDYFLSFWVMHKAKKHLYYSKKPLYYYIKGDDNMTEKLDRKMYKYCAVFRPFIYSVLLNSDQFGTQENIDNLETAQLNNIWMSAYQYIADNKDCNLDELDDILSDELSQLSYFCSLDKIKFSRKIGLYLLFNRYYFLSRLYFDMVHCYLNIKRGKRRKVID